MMQTILIAVLTAAQAYLLGSVDTGILISKFVYHDDVRNHGSGAAGMTNMLRTFGKKAAALTAAGDVLKGVAAVCIGRWLFHFLPADAGLSAWLGVYLAAILAVVGHLKPLYFGFKGGKGVLGSVTMAAAYPLLTLGYCLLRGYAVQDLLICLVGSVIMAAMVIYMHRSNIQRIRDGKEYRFGRHGKQ